jgi:hypothetical protein
VTEQDLVVGGATPEHPESVGDYCVDCAARVWLSPALLPKVEAGDAAVVCQQPCIELRLQREPDRQACVAEATLQELAEVWGCTADEAFEACVATMALKGRGLTRVP